MKKFFLAALALTLLLPAPSQAAFTAKQVIAAEFPTVLFSGQNVGFDTDFIYSETHKDVKNKVTKENGAKVKVSFDRYVQAEDETVAISIAVPEVRESGEVISNVFDGNLLARKSGDFYFRVNNVAQKLLDGVGTQDTAAWLGRWVHISLNNAIDSLNLDKELVNFQSEFDSVAVRLKYDLAVKRYGQPLTVISSGKITKNSAGQAVQTVRVRLNSSWYTVFQNLALEQYKKDHPTATAKQIADYKKGNVADMQEMRAELAKTQINLTVNLTTGKLTGLRVAYSTKESTYKYDYKYVGKNFKETKIVNGSKTEAFTANVTFRSVYSENLVEPVGALSWEEFVTLIMPGREEPPVYDEDHDDYNDEPVTNAPKLSDVAKDIGLDYTKFKQCIQEQKYLGKVGKDEAEAMSSGGAGTPYSIVIGPDGKTTPINGAYGAQVVDGVVKRALGQSVGNASDLPSVEAVTVRGVQPGEAVKGNPNARVTLVVFADLECPFCKQFNANVNEVLATNTDVKVVYRHFPLRTLHKNAEVEALGAECAHEQGKFWSYIDKLYTVTPSNDGMDVTL